MSTPVHLSRFQLTNSAPVGIALHFAKVNDVVIFVVNFIAIIPLAGMLSYATEEIALRTGEVLGGLLNASFGYALKSCRPRVPANLYLEMLLN